MLTSKQRAFLRAQANSLEPIWYAGKGGLTEAMVRQGDDALTARELIKGKVLESAPASARETAEALAAATHSEVVQVIGRTRRSRKSFCRATAAARHEGRAVRGHL